jgi:hypothetical protein
MMFAVCAFSSVDCMCQILLILSFWLLTTDYHSLSFVLTLFPFGSSSRCLVYWSIHYRLYILSSTGSCGVDVCLSCGAREANHLPLELHFSEYVLNVRYCPKQLIYIICFVSNLASQLKIVPGTCEEFIKFLLNQ